MEVTSTVEIVEPASEPVEVLAEISQPEPEPNVVAETMLVSTADLQETGDLNLTRAWGFE